MIAGRLREVKQTPHIDEELFLDGLESCAQDIGGKVLAPIETIAHRAETHDREAIRLLDDVLADGKVEQTEIASLKRARAMAKRSAECDHDAGELARHDAA